MTTLAEPAQHVAAGTNQGSEGWGLILIPILLCLGMLIFAISSATLPAPTPVPTGHTCGTSYEPRPGANC